VKRINILLPVLRQAGRSLARELKEAPLYG
jgi:hypothetical protein